MEEETMESFPVALSSNLHENSEGDRDFSLVLFTQDHQGQQTLGGRHFGDLESGTNEVGEVDIEENKLRCPSMNASCTFDCTIFKYILLLICALLYNGFLIGAVLYNLEHKNRIDWCSGLGFLVCLTSIFYICLFYKLVIKKLLLTELEMRTQGATLIKSQKTSIWIKAKWTWIVGNYWTKWVFLVLLVLAIIIFVAVDSSGQGRVIALLGLFSIIILSVLLTENPENISLQILVVGLFLNYLVGLSFHNWPWMSRVFSCVRSKMNPTGYFNQTFWLNIQDEDDNELGSSSTIIPTIFVLTIKLTYINVIFTILEHFRVVSYLLTNLGWMFKAMIGIDEIQAVAGLIHIFFGGPLEAMLILRHQMTNSISEATSLFTLGLIAASSYTINSPSSTEDYNPQNDATPIMHVISAWIISNLMHPKTQTKLTATSPRYHKKKQKFWRSIKEIAVPFLQIFFVIFATISVIASLDALFQYAGSLFDFQDLTLVYVLKYVFFPFIWILGLDEDKAFESAQLVATNMVTLFKLPEDLLNSPSARLPLERDQILMTSLVDNNLNIYSFCISFTFVTYFTKLQISAWRILRIFASAFLSVLLTTAILSSIVP